MPHSSCHHFWPGGAGGTHTPAVVEVRLESTVAVLLQLLCDDHHTARYILMASSLLKRPASSAVDGANKRTKEPITCVRILMQGYATHASSAAAAAVSTLITEPPFLVDTRVLSLRSHV